MSDEHQKSADATRRDEILPADDTPAAGAEGDKMQREIGGREGPEPTRYGDWEKNGRCIDF